MFESLVQRKQVKRAVASGLGLAMLAGCSSEAKNVAPNPVTSVPTPVNNAIYNCTPEGKEFTKAPTNLNYAGIAVALNVSPAEIANGSAGPATCDRPVPLSKINDGTLIASVAGFGDNCLIIGAQQNPNTYPEQKGILAVCAEVQ